MEKDRNQRSEVILNLTLEIICLLTGEDCVIVTKTSGENVTSSGHQLSGGWNRTQSSNMEPQSLIHERNNDLKILELANKIIQLLTGEDQDYVEGLKDLVMGNQQPLVSSGLTEAKEISGELHSFITSPDCTSEGSNIEIDIQATKYEGDIMDTDHPQIQCSYTSVKEESCDKEEFINPDIQIPKNHVQTDHILCNFKEECVSPKEEILTDVDISALTDYTQPQSTDIKVTSEEESLRDTDNCTSSGPRDVIYTNIVIKEEFDTHVVENVRDTVSTLAVETQHSPSRIDQIHQAKEKPFCPVCGKHFKCKSSFVTHQKLHTGERMYSCSVCGKTFTTKSYLTKHQKLHSDDKPHSCVECGKSFVSKTHLVTHHRVHTGEKPYSCSECGKTFNTKSYLTKHQKLHTGEKPHSCVECGKCFISRTHLVTHHRVHTGERPYSCSECGKTFSIKSNLVGHQKFHIGDRPYVCTECGKSFVVKRNLLLHQTIHTRHKLFSCSECEKCFTSSSALSRHLRSHKGEKPYLCTECNKCFVSSSDLSRHLRTHTGEKPYCCNECGKCFARKSNHLRHEKIHSR